MRENDIWVYDVTNGWHSGEMPARLVNKVHALCPNVQFHSNADWCSTALGYSSTEAIHFNVPAGKTPISDRPICNALVNADYLINMPIMKKHGFEHWDAAHHYHTIDYRRIEVGPTTQRRTHLPLISRGR